MNNKSYQWIKCEKGRMPEDFEEDKDKKVIHVLVTTTTGEVTKMRRTYANWAGDEFWSWEHIYDTPKAWMPLPEPYKENKKEMFTLNHNYEVHQRDWNSGNITAILYHSNILEECIDFCKKWNKKMDELYECKNVEDEYCYFADVYDNNIDEYVY